MGSAHGLAELSARNHADPHVVDAVMLKPVMASAIVDSVTELRKHSSRSARSPDQSAASSRLVGLNILVVDDVAINLQIARGLLSIEGAHVEVVDRGREAIAKVQRAPKPFDLVLMDVQMPEMDGYETTHRLRELPQMAGVPIVAMTANARDSDKAACFAAGMDNYIPKPIDIEVVVRTILDHISHGRSLRANAIPEHIEAALERMGNDRPLFATVAGRFIATSNALIDELRAALETGAVADATSELHKLKGAAGTVGNIALAELAAELEAELKRTGRLSDPGNDLPRLASLVAAGNTELERFLAVSKDAPVDPADAPQRDQTADRAQILQLIALLGERNLRALDVYQALAPALEARLPAASHAVLAAAINGLDFARAARVLDETERDR
jgi:CheY-like chemotaxis protein